VALKALFHLKSICDDVVVALFAGAMSAAALRFAHGSDASILKDDVAECVAGQPGKRASTNQVIVPEGTPAVSEVAPPVLPASCGEPPLTEIQT